MAVSGKTATYKMPYFLDSDSPPNMATVTKAIADRIEAVLAKGGDATIAADGTISLVSPNNGLYKLLGQASGYLVAPQAVGVYLLGSSVGSTELSPEGSMQEEGQEVRPGLHANYPPPLIPIEAASLAVSGKATRLKLHMSVMVNGTALAGRTLKGELHRVAMTGAEPRGIALNATEEVAGLQAVVEAPGGFSNKQAVSAAAALPADGIYCLCVQLSGGAIPANAVALVSAQLRIAHV
jgi:hypothetical protein